MRSIKSIEGADEENRTADPEDLKKKLLKAKFGEEHAIPSKHKQKRKKLLLVTARMTAELCL
jgi:hypothetical protein